MKRISLFFLALIISGINLSIAQWQQTNGPSGRIYSFALYGTNLFAGGDGGVFLSTNNGTSWTSVNNANMITTDVVSSLVVSGADLFAATQRGVFLSTNKGTNWSVVETDGSINSLVVSDTNLFAGGNFGVWLSNDNGTSWNAVNNVGLGGHYPPFVNVLLTSGTNIFAGTYNGVFLSTNNGTSWNAVSGFGQAFTDVHSFVVSGKNLFAGTYHYGVFRSTDNGTSWTAVNNGLTDMTISSLATSGTTIFAGTDSAGIYLSTNNGTSWNTTNIGVTNRILSLTVSDTYLFAGLYFGGIWRRPLSEMITSVEKLTNDMPTRFSLEQNYPNPFNPSTIFSFTLPSKSFVSLKVFDFIGREVISLVSEEMSAGTYSRQWNAANMSSGIYYYRLQTNSFTETKKLVLLK
jgi:hypothetical protein